jgi:hypothetical protein
MTAGSLLRATNVCDPACIHTQSYPTVLAVQQGETITFRVTNAGIAEHEFKVGR